MNNRNQTGQEQDQQNQDQDILNPQDFLPPEINSYMLSFLSYSDINQVIKTSKYWNKRAIEARYYIKNLTEQLELLEGDELWKILPQANNQIIVNEFFKKNLLMPGQEEDLKTLDEFKNLKSNDVLDLFSSKLDEYKTGFIIPFSNLLLQLKERLKTKNFDHPTSLISLLNFPLEYEKQQYNFFLSYLKLVRSFSLFRFNIQIEIDKRIYVNIGTVGASCYIMLANPQLSRNLPMSSLGFAVVARLLDRLFVPNNSQGLDQRIKTCLKELTIHDWILFLTSSTSFSEALPLFKKFFNALPHLHLSNKTKTKFELLHVIVVDLRDYTDDRRLRLVINILASELVSEIDSKTIIKLIEDHIDIKNLGIILSANPRIVKKFNLEAAINFVKVDSRKALVLLKNINFLNKLNLNDLLKIFENLHGNTYREYLDCNELRIRLNTEDKLLRSHFLYKVINLRIEYFSNHSPPRAFEMLEISHLIHLGEIDPTIKILDLISVIIKMNSHQLAQLTIKRRVNDIAANYLHLFNNYHFKLLLKQCGDFIKQSSPKIWKEKVVPEMELRKKLEQDSHLETIRNELKVETKIFDLDGREITPMIKKEETGDQTCRYTLYDKDNEIGFLDLSIGHTSEDLADFVNIKHKVVSHEYNQAELALNEIVLQVCLNENKQSVRVFPSSAKDILFYYGQGYRHDKWDVFSWNGINVYDEEELGVKAYLKWKYKKLISNDSLNQFLQKYTFEKEVDNLKLGEYDPISLERYTWDDLFEFFHYLYQNKTTQEFREKLCLIMNGFYVFSLPFIFPKEIIAAKKQQRLLLRNQNIPEDTTSTEETTQSVSGDSGDSSPEDAIQSSSESSSEDEALQKSSVGSSSDEEIQNTPKNSPVDPATQNANNEAKILANKAENIRLYQQAYDKQQRQNKIRIGLIVLFSIVLTPLSLVVSIPLWFRAKSKDKELPLQVVKTTEMEFDLVKSLRVLFRDADTKIKDSEKPSKFLIATKGKKRTYVMDKGQAYRYRLFADIPSLDVKDSIMDTVERSKSESKRIMQQQRSTRPV